ncbi:MAG: pyridoxamine 5'-phosphate oxidase family protein [Candidatus Binatia bacterium]|nr:pyridoxamine 5'-phosphate oxidase family protein [Candidatus Binatia bacterium]
MRWRATILCAVGVVFGLTTVGRAQLLPQGLPLEVAEKLVEAKQIYVATQRQDGSRSEAAPVWFGIMEGAVWFTTSPDSHKGKRIRRGSPVFVSVQGKKGPFVRLRAEIVNDGDKAEALGKIYERKYWLAWLGFFRPSKERVQSGKVLLIRLTAEGGEEPQRGS